MGEIADERPPAHRLEQPDRRRVAGLAAGSARAYCRCGCQEAGKPIGAVIDKHKMKKHFALDVADGRFTFRRRRASTASTLCEPAFQRTRWARSSLSAPTRVSRSSSERSGR
jgi:hypothetical protein